MSCSNLCFKNSRFCTNWSNNFALFYRNRKTRLSLSDSCHQPLLWGLKCSKSGPKIKSFIDYQSICNRWPLNLIGRIPRLQIVSQRYIRRYFYPLPSLKPALCKMLGKMARQKLRSWEGSYPNMEVVYIFLEHSKTYKEQNLLTALDSQPEKQYQIIKSQRYFILHFMDFRNYFVPWFVLCVCGGWNSYPASL